MKQCDTCGGSGIHVQYRQHMLGLVQQVQSHCRKCSGTGEVIRGKCRIRSVLPCLSCLIGKNMLVEVLVS